jgi:MFS family permease
VTQSEPSVPRASHGRYQGWGVVVAAFFGVMVGYSVLVPYTFGLFLKPLSAAFGWRRDQISVAFGCVAVTVALCSPLIGRLLDRYGPRRTILPCIVVFGLGFASLSLLTPSLLHFYLVFIFVGLAGNGTTQLAYSRAASTWFFERRGLALSLIAAGAGVGAMALPLLAAWLIQNYGWRTAYRTLGLLALAVSFPLTSLLVREAEPLGPSNVKTENRLSTPFLASIRTRPFQLLVLAIFLYSITFNGVISHLSALLTDRGLSLKTAAQALSVLGACGLAGRLATGFLLDRFFGVRVSMVFFLTTVAGVLLLSQGKAVAAFTGVAMIGFAAGGESDITPYLLSRYFSLQNFSTLYGLAWTAYAMGTAVGPVLMGKLYTSTGSYESWGIQLLAVPTLLSALCMALMPPYPAKAWEEVNQRFPSATKFSQTALSDL